MSQPLLLPKIDEPSSQSGPRWKVTIYNNDYTAQEAVFDALIRATNCDAHEAEIEIWEAERFGHAAVHFAVREECESAAQIISGIGVRTEVSPEWDD
jgi:ATP-dependent Clp protease adapter protein ClpS